MSEKTTSAEFDHACANMPKPGPEHEWLQKFLGEWTSETQIFMDPGQPPMNATGSESVRALGGFWIIADGKGDMGGMPFESRLTLGYDLGLKKYVGTWTDNMTPFLWKYEGTVDAAGKVLTLLTKGPSHTGMDKLVDYREVTEFKSDDHRVFTSTAQQEDGSWRKIVEINFRRKK